jgi:hypothetical protein
MAGRTRLGVAWVAAACVSAASAHHSAAMYDSDKSQVLVGTVQELQWTAPHVWLQLNVAKGKKSELWGIEALNPMQLGRMGWKRTSFRPGDQVTVTVHPHRDGRLIGQFVSARLPDGSTLGGRPSSYGAPGTEATK